MIQYTRQNLLTALLATVASALLLTAPVSAQTQAIKRTAHSASFQQPLYNQYRGVVIGMDARDVRVKLGEPVSKGDDMDLYVFSDNETAQVAYDSTHKVKVVSVDYLNGIGAPDSNLVVGPNVDVLANGRLYKMMRYESLGFWVSYNRSAGEVPVVTITIQKTR
jgi:hypothetical protein